MTRLGRALPRQPSTERWMTLVILLAFFLHSLALQVHVHQAAPPPAVAAAATQPGHTPLKSQDPVDQCRLCQEMAHAGAFIAPSAAAACASLVIAWAAYVTLPLAVISARTAFAWQSRAPPRP